MATGRSSRANLRASDADREEAASLLRESLAEGRLTMDEFDERLEAAYAARTYGDLDVLSADLPRAPSASATAWSDARSHLLEQWEARRSTKECRRWTRFVSVNTLCWAIWGLASFGPGQHHVETMWPLWVTVPWGLLLVTRSPRLAGTRSRPTPSRGAQPYGPR